MLNKLIWNDIRQNKLLSAATVFFMAVSAMMLSLTALLCFSLFGSVNGLMEQARVPDLVQMHSGELNEVQIDQFVEEHQEIGQWQLCRILSLDNSGVTLGSHSLLDSTQDNGLCVQNAEFDFLLGMDSKRLEVLSGQVYVPACYRARYNLSIGDTMQIGSKKLTIAGFLRDAQMNSMMASSKRFLVSEWDYERLKASGEEEYLIEFLLKDGSDVNNLSTAYTQHGLPANGPAITKPLIRMMNALSDGTTILVIFLTAVVVLLVSLLCIRFILSIRMERDRREVGMLKALGIGKGEVKRLYFLKYILFSVCGALLGFGASTALQRPLEQRIRELYGAADNSGQAAAICTAAVVEAAILLFVWRSLKQTDKLSVLNAKELELSIGDTLLLEINGEEIPYTVCGIYSDITNGGKTAKADGRVSSSSVIWSVAYVSLKDPAASHQWMEIYRQTGAEATDIEEYVQDAYGPTLAQLRLALIGAMLIAALVAFVLIALFMRLIVEQSRDAVSLQKALGFTGGDITRAYFMKGFLSAAAGVLSGLFFGTLLGEGLCGIVLKSFGADGFRFIIRWDCLLVGIPAVILGTTISAILTGTDEVRRIKAYECCTGRD